MLQIFQRLIENQPWGMIILIVLIGSIAQVIGGIAKEIRRYSCHRQDIEFKRELVDRGLPAEEIDRIVAAQPLPEKSEVIGSHYYTPAPAPQNS